MKRRQLTLSAAITGSLLLAGSTTLLPVREACAQERTVSYSEDIVPIFRGWCVSCHQPGGKGYGTSGFDLSTYEGLMKGTKFGAVVVPGQPDISNLIVLIEGRAAPEIRMPLGHKPLPSCLRRTIWSWVFEGANEN